MARLRSVVVVLALLACGCAEPPPAQHVLFVVVDTLRADRLGSYGAAGDTSPVLDRLAAGSVRFERAYAPAPWTKPSVASLFTGLYPSAHGVQGIDDPLPEAAQTLADTLRARGFATAAVVSNVVIGGLGGFAQGFEAYDEAEAWAEDRRDHVSTGGVTDRALARLERLAGGEQRFFLFVHYFDPHYNYRNHSGIDFAPPRAGRLDGRQSITELRQLAPELSAAELRYLEALDDEEIRRTDTGIGRLLGGLDALGLAGSTLVVVTADHGEELGERGWIGHTRTLHEELIRVPLLIRQPGARPRVVHGPVSLVSVAPKILELLGLDPAPFSRQARSLASLVRDGHEGDDAVYTEVDFLPIIDPNEAASKKAVIVGRHKLIRDDRSGRLRLFDLEVDPAEQTNLAPQRAERRAELRKRLEEHLARSATLRGQREHRPSSDDEIERLRELGYLTPHDAT